jgi:rod shape-determining protein MreD
MVDPATARIWLGRAAFALTAIVVIFWQLLPIDTVPGVWAWPDVLLLATLVWVVRRPEYLPVWLVALTFLLADLLFHRPPGLFAALTILLTEALRRRTTSLRNAPFIGEWVTVAAGIAAVTLGNRLVLAIVMTPQAPLGLTLIQMLMTMLAYPAIVGLAVVAFGITRPTPGEAGTKV